MGLTGQPQAQSNDETSVKGCYRKCEHKGEAKRSKIAQRFKSNKMGREINGEITKFLTHC